ncbi:hypothetical protein [Pseudomonas sp. LFM046]|uniref:hypothetical protein n=1 Tax=Pseudomonas sp. LFM046 TaxID=1608357 RepID=UPI001F5B6340|nr:hypothetical protein [Pseudomonas sp. LFM046]
MNDSVDSDGVPETGRQTRGADVKSLSGPCEDFVMAQWNPAPLDRAGLVRISTSQQGAGKSAVLKIYDALAAGGQAMTRFRIVTWVTALFLAASAGSTWATEQAQQRRAARDVRQETRQDARQIKQDCRAADQQYNAECRQDKRQTKQQGRERARDIKY